MNLPPQYLFLQKNPPKIGIEALKLLGIKEVVGDGNSPIILMWADEIGGWVADFYKEDAIPWCGLFVGICAKRAGYPFGQKILSAAAWADWGQKADVPSLWDVLIFKRLGGGHVGFYVGEDQDCYHILGGNQSDMVKISRIEKSRMVAARRCIWKVGQPPSIKPVTVAYAGAVSKNEA